MSWYTLYTSPRAEKQVYDRLERLSIDAFLPLHASPRRWSDRIKLVEVPLFPSYLFVNTNEPEVRSLLTVPGVSRIVYYDGKPAVIKDKEIHAIQSFLEQARAKELCFTPDQEVLIACGPLKDISGKVKKIKKTHLILHLEQLGITVSVSLNQVLKKALV